VKSEQGRIAHPLLGALSRTDQLPVVAPRSEASSLGDRQSVPSRPTGAPLSGVAGQGIPLAWQGLRAWPWRCGRSAPKPLQNTELQRQRDRNAALGSIVGAPLPAPDRVAIDRGQQDLAWYEAGPLSSASLAFPRAAANPLASAQEESPLSAKSRSGSPLRYASEMIAGTPSRGSGGGGDGRPVRDREPMAAPAGSFSGSLYRASSARGRPRRVSHRSAVKEKPDWDSSTLMQTETKSESDPSVTGKATPGSSPSAPPSPPVSPPDGVPDRHADVAASRGDGPCRGQLTECGLRVGGMLDPSPGSRPGIVRHQ
jgi:hypothetical protein